MIGGAFALKQKRRIEIRSVTSSNRVYSPYNDGDGSGPVDVVYYNADVEKSRKKKLKKDQIGLLPIVITFAIGCGTLILFIGVLVRRYSDKTRPIYNIGYALLGVGFVCIVYSIVKSLCLQRKRYPKLVKSKAKVEPKQEPEPLTVPEQLKVTVNGLQNDNVIKSDKMQVFTIIQTPNTISTNNAMATFDVGDVLKEIDEYSHFLNINKVNGSNINDERVIKPKSAFVTNGDTLH